MLEADRHLDRAQPGRTGPPLGHVAKATLVVVGVLALCTLVYTARTVLALIFLGFLGAVCLEPVVAALGRRGVRRGAAVALSALVLVGVLVALVLLLVVPAVRQAGDLVDQLPQRLQSLSDRLGGEDTALGRFLASNGTEQTYGTSLDRLLGLLAGAASGVFGVVGAVLGAILSGFTVFVIAIYVSLDMPRLRGAAARALGTPARVRTMDEALGKVSAYVIGQGAVCVVAGACAYAYFQLAGVPYPAVLALVVLALDAIPQVGATLASVVGIAAALTVSLPLALVTLGYFLVYQQVENYLVAPRVFAKAISITPLAAFVSVLLGAAVAGVPGAVLALPLTGAAKVVVRQVLDERAAKAATAAPVPAPR